MQLDADQQIKRKVLQILRDHGGRWSQKEFDQIETGTIQLAPYLKELIEQGYVYHDQTQHMYVLTDAGGRHLTELTKGARPPI